MVTRLTEVCTFPWATRGYCRPQVCVQPTEHTVYFVTLNGVQDRIFGSNEYVEALEYAAQLDFVHNSPELNDGVQGTNDIKLLTLPEMMMSDVVMVI